MIKNITYLLLSLLITSCITHSTLFEKPVDMYSKYGTINFYKVDNETVGDKQFSIAAYKKTTLPVLGYIRGTFIKQHYLVNWMKKEYFVESSELITLFDRMADTLTSEIIVPKDYEDLYWRRAILFAGQNTNMKMGIVNDYIIETDEPAFTPNIITTNSNVVTKKVIDKDVKTDNKTTSTTILKNEVSTTVESSIPYHFGWLIIKENLSNNLVRIKIIMKDNGGHHTVGTYNKKATFFLLTGDDCYKYSLQ